MCTMWWLDIHYRMIIYFKILTYSSPPIIDSLCVNMVSRLRLSSQYLSSIQCHTGNYTGNYNCHNGNYNCHAFYSRSSELILITESLEPLIYSPHFFPSLCNYHSSLCLWNPLQAAILPTPPCFHQPGSFWTLPFGVFTEALLHGHDWLHYWSLVTDSLPEGGWGNREFLSSN